MVRHGHDPEWPDKVVFAGLTLVLAGLAGIAFVAVQASTATVRELIPGIMGDVPRWLTASLCGATVALGALAVRHQAAIWVMVGAITAVGSMGIYGAVPLLAIVALAFLFRAWREGEELAHDDRRVTADEWPDKAFAASALLMVAGVVTLLQGALILADRFQPLLLGRWPVAAGLWALVAGLASLWGARQSFRLVRPWGGAIGAVAALLGAGFYVLGPALGLAALELLRRADQEDEFVQATPA